MKYIKKMIDEMCDEIHSAKKYAEKSIELKSKGDQTSLNNSSKFKSISNQELEHATFLHELLVKEIDRLKTVYQPPQDMLEIWEEKHKGYVEKVAWIKQMLNL